MKSERIYIRLPAELKEEFLGLCDERAVNPSKLIRQWVEGYIESAEKEKLNKGF